MKRPDITPQLLKKLYWKKQLSKKEIAVYLHCNITTVHKKMQRFCIARRSQKEATKLAVEKQVISISKPLLEKLYSRKKLSIPQIAKQLKHDQSIIKRELIRHAMPLRSKSEATKTYYERNRIKKSVLLNLYYKENLTQKQIAAKLQKSIPHISLLMKKYDLKTRGPATYHTKYQKFPFSNNFKEKAYLIGFRLGDLHVKLLSSGKIIKVDCTSTKDAQINLFRGLFKDYGPIWIGKPRKDGNRVFVTYLNRSFAFLIPKKDNIPFWVRKNKKYFLSFVAGYIDAEGCFWSSRNRAHFTLASYDKRILKQIYLGLLNLGLPCNPPRILVRQGHRKADGLIYRNDHWYFTITKKSSLLWLFQLLSHRLRHQKRLEDLKKVKQNILDRNQRFFIKSSRKNLPV